MASSLKGQNVLITGASMGIGASIAKALAQHGANLILFSRTDSKLHEMKEEISALGTGSKVTIRAVDVQQHQQVSKAVEEAIKEAGDIDILINNAGLALGAPAIFPELSLDNILQMNNTNINGLMFTTHAVLNASFMKKKAGTILNVTSTTALEAPPFPGEAVYHANKACQEGFTNSLRNELQGTNIRVLALRPGVVATHFHRQRVQFDDKQYDEFTQGFTPLEADEVATQAVWMLQQPLNISVKALDVVPSAQRSLTVIDKTWNERQKS